MKFVQGNLYKCPEYYLLVYPTLEKAVADGRAPGSVSAGGDAAGAAYWANHWSKKLNCKVRYSNPEDPMLFLEETKIDQERFLRFLLPGFEGWIVWREWLKIEEVKP